MNENNKQNFTTFKEVRLLYYSIYVMKSGLMNGRENK